jgi:hypothetical protein
VVFTEKALAAKNALKLAQEIIATQGSDNLNETGYKTLANYARNIADYFLKYCDKCFEESISLPPMKPLVEEATIPSSLCLR